MESNQGMAPIEDANVTLRPMRRSDSPAVLDLLRQPGVARRWGEHDAPRVERDFFEPAWAYSYLVLSGGRLAGVVQFHEVPDPDYKSVAIDIALGDDFTGRGVGTETLRVLIAYLIDERGHHRLTVDPAVDNARAIHAYGKVGFRPVGVMRDYERAANGTWHDNLLMDLLADEFVRE